MKGEIVLTILHLDEAIHVFRLGGATCASFSFTNFFLCIIEVFLPFWLHFTFLVANRGNPLFLKKISSRRFQEHLERERDLGYYLYSLAMKKSRMLS